MTNGEKHIEKLLSWYKEAVTEDGVCYLTSDDQNTLAYAIKCCKHFEDIKKDIDSWMLREESSSSEIPTGTPNTISFKEMTDNLKITADDIENAEDLEYSIEPLVHPKNDLGVEDEERKLALMYLEQIKDDYIEGVGYERHPLPEYYAIETAIKSLALPSVTPQEPKTGHWELVQRGKCIDICCSNCKATRIKEYAYNYIIDRLDKEDVKECLESDDMRYCPYCGSDNREVEE